MLKFFTIFISGCLVLITASSQNDCNIFPVQKLDIILNPSFESGNNCSSGFIGYSSVNLPNWYALNYLIPMTYYNSCSNFIIPDQLYSAALNRYFTAPLQSVDFSQPFIDTDVPMPVPDGKGVVEITDNAVQAGEITDSQWIKNYIGTCLTHPLKKDSLYKLDFYVGFGNKSVSVEGFYFTCNTSSPSSGCQPGYIYLSKTTSPKKAEITLFGTADCNELTKKFDNGKCLSF